MSSATHHRASRRAHPPFIERLQLLAELLANDRDAPSQIAIGVLPAGDGVELHVLPLLTDDPLSEMADIAAQPEWKAFGIATGGNARLTAGPEGPTERVRLVVLVDRTGRLVSAMTGHHALIGAPEGTMASAIEGPDTHLGQGRIPDACRRVLGLPTDPPPVPVSSLIMLQWLDALVEAALNSPGEVTWERAGDLIPVTLGKSWTDVRHLSAQGVLDRPAIQAHVAEWMDDGMFAREALSTFLPPELMFTMLVDTVSHAVLSQVLDALDTILGDSDPIEHQP